MPMMKTMYNPPINQSAIFFNMFSGLPHKSFRFHIMPGKAAWFIQSKVVKKDEAVSK